MFCKWSIEASRLRSPLTRRGRIKKQLGALPKCETLRGVGPCLSAHPVPHHKPGRKNMPEHAWIWDGSPCPIPQAPAPRFIGWFAGFIWALLYWTASRSMLILLLFSPTASPETSLPSPSTSTGSEDYKLGSSAGPNAIAQLLPQTVIPKQEIL